MLEDRADPNAGLPGDLLGGRRRALRGKDSLSRVKDPRLVAPCVGAQRLGGGGAARFGWGGRAWCHGDRRARAQLTSGVISPYPSNRSRDSDCRSCGLPCPCTSTAAGDPTGPSPARAPPDHGGRPRHDAACRHRSVQAEGSTDVANHPAQPPRRSDGRELHPPLREGDNQGDLSERLWRFTRVQPGWGLGRIRPDGVVGVLGTSRAAPCLVARLRGPGCPAHGAVSRLGPRGWSNPPRPGCKNRSSGTAMSHPVGRAGRGPEQDPSRGFVGDEAETSGLEQPWHVRERGCRHR